MRTAAPVTAWTTGAGIALAINGCELHAILLGSATTLTIKSGTDTVFILNSHPNLSVPIPISGTVSGTSSGGSFAVQLATY